MTNASRFFASLSLFLSSLLFSAAGFAQEPTAPDVLVKNVTLEVIDIIAKDKEIRSGDRSKLIGVIDAKVLPHFNFASMTALAMGQNWKTATPEQRKLLIDAFRTLLVRTYASALAAYSEQKFDFRPLRAKPADTDVTVQVRVIQPGAQPVPIDYSMEKTPGGWKVYDVMVGGVSLIANYRTEFAAVVRNSGVDGLIKELQAKNRSLEEKGAQKK
jgi:phospholipid transport system substrate-binding protein